MTGVPADSGEGRLSQRRLIRLGVAIALAGIAVAAALGARLRLEDLFFALAMLGLLSYYEEWGVQRKRVRAAALVRAMLCVIALLVSDFA